MTVAELILRLSEMEQDREVWIRIYGEDFELATKAARISAQVHGWNTDLLRVEISAYADH